MFRESCTRETFRKNGHEKESDDKTNHSLSLTSCYAYRFKHGIPCSHLLLVSSLPLTINFMLELHFV